jgi:hypothetical protein
MKKKKKEGHAQPFILYLVLSHLQNLEIVPLGSIRTKFPRSCSYHTAKVGGVEHNMLNFNLK